MKTQNKVQIFLFAGLVWLCYHDIYICVGSLFANEEHIRVELTISPYCIWLYLNRQFRKKY